MTFFSANRSTVALSILNTICAPAPATFVCRPSYRSNHKTKILKADFGDSDNTKLSEMALDNPLENHVILSHLFELSSPKDLAKYRLVCKDWYKLSLSYWRSITKLTFWGDFLYGDCGAFWDHEAPTEQNPTTTLCKFLDYFEDPQNECEYKPYRQFILREWEMKIDVDLDRFWNVCGPNITNLEVNDCYFHNVDIFRKLVREFCPNLTKLILKDYKLRFRTSPPEEPSTYIPPLNGEHLNLKCLEIDMDYENLPITWVEILSYFPNLETLKLYNADQDDVLECMLEAIKIIRTHDKRKLRIKHLDILSASLYALDVISSDACELLRALKLPLETLIIDFGIQTQSNVIHDIIQTHEKTLTRLDVYRGPVSTPYATFPFGIQLDKLQSITMSDRLSKDMEFLKFVPNLTRLKICDVVEDRAPMITTAIIEATSMSEEMQNLRLEKVAYLRFDYVCTPNNLKRLTQWMPNVESLRMPLNNEKFRLVCESWLGLTEIVILGNKLDDYGITGMTSAQMYTRSQKAGELKTAIYEDDSIDDNATPNITYLRHLRTFKMENDNVLPTKLLDSSVYNGLLLLPYLSCLRLCAQISKDATNALKEKVLDCEVVTIRNYVQYDDSEG